MTANDYVNEISIDWEAHLGKYTLEVLLDTGREQLVFDTLQDAQNYRRAYAGDIALLLGGFEPEFNSGAVL